VLAPQFQSRQEKGAAQMHASRAATNLARTLAFLLAHLRTSDVISNVGPAQVRSGLSESVRGRNATGVLGPAAASYKSMQPVAEEGQWAAAN
jgi:hypothetical protein